MRAWFIISALCLTSMSASIVLPMKVAIAQTVNDRKVEADRLLAQGVREYQTNQFEASLKSGQEALKIYREVSDNNGEAWALNNLGSAYRIFNQTEKSILYYEKALSIFNKLGDYKGEASALRGLGIISSTRSEHNRAILYYQKALVLFERTENFNGKLDILGRLADAHLSKSEKKEVIFYYQKQLEILPNIKDYDTKIDLIYRFSVSNETELVGFPHITIAIKELLNIIENPSIIPNTNSLSTSESFRALILPNYAVYLDINNHSDLAIILYKKSSQIKEKVYRESALSSAKRRIVYHYMKQNIKGTYAGMTGLLLTQGRLFEAQQALELMRIGELESIVFLLKQI